MNSDNVSIQNVDKEAAAGAALKSADLLGIVIDRTIVQPLEETLPGVIPPVVEQLAYLGC